MDFKLITVRSDSNKRIAIRIDAIRTVVETDDPAVCHIHTVEGVRLTVQLSYSELQGILIRAGVMSI